MHAHGGERPAAGRVVQDRSGGLPPGGGVEIDHEFRQVWRVAEEGADLGGAEPVTWPVDLALSDHVVDAEGAEGLRVLAPGEGAHSGRHAAGPAAD